MPKVYTLTETTTDATHYYLVKPLNVAIPKTPDSVEVLNAILLNNGAYHLPQGLADYPIITRAQLSLFPDCKPQEVKIKVKVADTIDPKLLQIALKLKKDRPCD
jgi:hypothetical protein